jgi:hypothetical protein
LARNFFVWGATVAATAALWGCGDDDSSSSSGGGEGSTTKAEFVQQANQICEAGKREGLEATSAYAKERADSGQSRRALISAALRNAFLPEVQDQVDEIRQLEVPAGDQEEVDEYLEAMEEAIADSAKTARASLTSFGANFQRSADLARAYGLTGCAYG